MSRKGAGRSGLGVTETREETSLMPVERNLILVHQPGCQDVADFQEIARYVHDMAPDIEVFIASNEIPSSVTRRKASGRPTLIFSPVNLIAFHPARGKIYAGRPIPKLEQMTRFVSAGLPVPRFAEITPDLDLPEEVFGSHVVVKPGFPLVSRGKDTSLMRRESVRYQSPKSFPEDHAGRYGPMIVQRFVDTGALPSVYRVLVLFGEVLYAARSTSTVARPGMNCTDMALAETNIAVRRGTGQTKILIEDSDVLELARRARNVFPDVPLHACDIIREEATGKLFLLEINPGGNTWVFSRASTPALIAELLGISPTKQFDAFRTAAKVLVDRTRFQAE